MGKIKIAILVVVMVALVGGYYFYLSNFKKTSDEVTVTAVQDVVLKNLETDYPPTPREVLKYYSDITKCLYNENYTDAEFEQMADKLLALYDSELLEINPREKYLVKLKGDVDDYREKGYVITTYTTSKSTDVEEFTEDGRKCAKLYCTYTVKTGPEYKATRHVFIMRKDTERGHWKILGFEADIQDQAAQ